MIDERELREMLERRAATISATPTDTPKAIRRARRRLALNAAVGTLVGLAVLAGALAGVRTIQTAPTPADEPTPTPTPADVGALAYGLDGDIYVADWDGANPVRIADGRPPTLCHGIGEYWWEGSIWSPDGRYLAYRHTDCDAPLDGPWYDVVISDPQGNVVTSIASEGWGISWSPDSTRVAVWVRIGRTIGVYGPDGERQALLTVPREIQGLGPGPMTPRWSPTGEQLLYSNFEIPLDGSPPGEFPSGDPRSLASLQATYSPDGSRVAYTLSGSLVVAAADGSDARHLVERWVRSPVWSPTGDRIAFTWGARGGVWRGNATELRVLDVATGRVTVLVEAGEAGGSVMPPGAASAPFEFSPEGDRILFSRTEVEGAGANSLWSVNVDGSDLRRLVARTAMGDWLSPTQAG